MDIGVSSAETEPGNERSDPAKIVSRIGQGDVSAETELFDRYASSIHFFLGRRYRDPMLIEDVLQETFYRVIKRLRKDGLDDPEALPGFVRQTALNVAREHIRQDGKYESAIGQDQVIDLPAYEKDPLDLVTEKELKRIVREVLDELPVKRDRTILIRFYYENVDKPVICRELELDTDYFDKVIHRARNRLRQKIMHKYGTRLANAAMSLVIGGAV